MEKENFDVIYSLGKSCDCAMNMKRARLRGCSGPLDWVGLTVFNQNIDYILNGFSGFLVEENLEPLINEYGEKSGYIGINKEIRFRHDFDLAIPLCEAFPKVVLKYKRRIDRFYKLIAESEKVLFIYQGKPAEVNIDDAKIAVEKLNKKFGDKIYLTLMIVDESVKKHKVEVNNINAHLKSYTFSTPPSKRGRIKFFRKIYGQYECGLVIKANAKNNKGKIRALKDFFFMKIIGNLIPIRRLRRKFRDYLSRSHRYD